MSDFTTTRVVAERARYIGMLSDLRETA